MQNSFRRGTATVIMNSTSRKIELAIKTLTSYGSKTFSSTKRALFFKLSKVFPTARPLNHKAHSGNLMKDHL